jgi:hypothetical protein
MSYGPNSVSPFERVLGKPINFGGTPGPEQIWIKSDQPRGTY